MIEVGLISVFTDELDGYKMLHLYANMNAGHFDCNRYWLRSNLQLLDGLPKGVVSVAEVRSLVNRNFTSSGLFNRSNISIA